MKEQPIHPAFNYLSANHKSDYVRAYMLYHYGGGYHDIKFREKSWENEWDKFQNKDIWMVGRRETYEDAIGFPPGEEWLKKEFSKLITMGWIITRPKTEYLERLYNKIHEVLSSKLELLQKNPAICPRQTEQTDINNPEYLYPLRWLEIMGEIFHKLLLEFTDKIDYSLPDILYKNYK